MKSQTNPTQAELDRALGSHVGKSRLNLEGQLLKSVLDWLNTLPNCRAWRQNTGAMQYQKANGKTGIVRFGQPGMSDITGMVYGIRLEIEVKATGKRPTPEQGSWINFIRERNGVAFWCDSLESCCNHLRVEFITHGWTWDSNWEIR